MEYTPICCGHASLGGVMRSMDGEQSAFQEILGLRSVFGRKLPKIAGRQAGSSRAWQGVVIS